MSEWISYSLLSPASVVQPGCPSGVSLSRAKSRTEGSSAIGLGYWSSPPETCRAQWLLEAVEGQHSDVLSHVGQGLALHVSDFARDGVFSARQTAKLNRKQAWRVFGVEWHFAAAIEILRLSGD